MAVNKAKAKLASQAPKVRIIIIEKKFSWAQTPEFREK